MGTKGQRTATRLVKGQLPLVQSLTTLKPMDKSYSLDRPSTSSAGHIVAQNQN